MFVETIESSESISVQAFKNAVIQNKSWLTGLRPYQVTAWQMLMAAWGGAEALTQAFGDRTLESHGHEIEILPGVSAIQNVLVCAPTGAGKTLVFIRALSLALWARDKKIMMVAERDELVSQMHQAVKDSGIPESEIGRIQAYRSGGYALELHKPIQIASIQSLSAKDGQGWQDLEVAGYTPDVIVIDECKHAIACLDSDRTSQYYPIWKNYPTARKVGLDATPNRADGKGFLIPECDQQALGLYQYQALLIVSTRKKLQEEGFLPSTIIFDGVSSPKKRRKVKNSMAAGDFSDADQLETMGDKKLIGKAVVEWKDKVLSRYGALRTMAFGVNIAHVENIVSEYKAEGVKAVSLHSRKSKPEQLDALRDFITGESPVLVCASMGLEGFDLAAYCDILKLPKVSVACVQILRKTRNLPLFIQMIGRARGVDLFSLRPESGTLSVPSALMPKLMPKINDVVLGGKHQPDKCAVVLGEIAGLRSHWSTAADLISTQPNQATQAMLGIIQNAIALPSSQAGKEFVLWAMNQECEYPEIIETALDKVSLDWDRLHAQARKKFNICIILDHGDNFKALQFVPNTLVRWSLTAAKALKEEDLIQCAHCKALLTKLDKECPSCGVVFELDSPAEMEEISGNSPNETPKTDDQKSLKELDVAAMEAKFQQIKMATGGANMHAIAHAVCSGCSIPELVALTKQCKKKDGTPVKPISAFWKWAEHHLRTDASWSPTPGQFREWVFALEYKPGYVTYLSRQWEEKRRELVLSSRATVLRFGYRPYLGYKYLNPETTKVRHTPPKKVINFPF